MIFSRDKKILRIISNGLNTKQGRPRKMKTKNNQAKLNKKFVAPMDEGDRRIEKNAQLEMEKFIKKIKRLGL